MFFSRVAAGFSNLYGHPGGECTWNQKGENLSPGGGAPAFARSHV